jgi:hypothetical protein
MSKRSGESLKRMKSYAAAYPVSFYQNQFEKNEPIVPLVRFTGRSALVIVRPELIFPGSQSKKEYQEQFDDGPVIFTFTHGGKRRLHDPALALSAVYALPAVRKRAAEFAVWAAAPYFAESSTGPLIRFHGAISVIREKDEPDHDKRKRISSALFDRSARHVSEGGILVNFPAGTKSSEEIKAGIACVAERAERNMASTIGHIVTLAMWSKNSATGLVPRGAVVSFGEPIELGAGNEPRSSETFLDLIVASQQAAMDRLP